MPGACVPDATRRAVELDVGQRRGRGRRHGLDEGVEPVEQHRGARGLREGADGPAELAHRDRRVEAVPDDVADHERQDTGLQLECVVPVAADLERRCPRSVGRGDDDVLEGGHPPPRSPSWSAWEVSRSRS